MLQFVRLAAQANITAPGISYEGQTVSAVEIAGRPDVDAGELQASILQPANAPYSQQKVDETMAKLKRDGRFQNVKAEVTPETNGLRVLFVLQPAFYFGVFQFPDAVNNFSYTQLLQATNYSRQEPYTRERVEKAEANLIELFHQNGYFLATVEPELQTDHIHRVVNVIFRTKLKRHAHFGKIHLTGASTPETQKLERSLHSLMARVRGAYLKTGASYSLKKLQSGCDLSSDHGAGNRSEDRGRTYLGPNAKENHPYL